jgi:hypothetical protein
MQAVLRPIPTEVRHAGPDKPHTKSAGGTTWRSSNRRTPTPPVIGGNAIEFTEFDGTGLGLGIGGWLADGLSDVSAENGESPRDAQVEAVVETLGVLVGPVEPDGSTAGLSDATKRLDE